MSVKNESYISSLSGEYCSKYVHKFESKPKPVQIMARRTFSTATVILGFIKDIPYSTLVSSIYLHCKDYPIRWLLRELEGQMELAGANPERFIFQLHQFYNIISAKIKKQNLYPEICDLLGFYLERMYCLPDEVDADVGKAFTNLLFQLTTYLRKSKFDFATRLLGAKATGEPIFGDDIFPYADLPSYELEMLYRNGILNRLNTESTITNLYSKYGMQISTLKDIVEIDMIQRISENMFIALLPYVNEQTLDILPKTIYSTPHCPLQELYIADTSYDLSTVLKDFRKPLKNSMRITFSDISGELKELLLKETTKNETTIMLYRLTTDKGDVAGYYNTETEFFYSLGLEATAGDVHSTMRELILYCYALCTTDQFRLKDIVIANYGIPVLFEMSKDLTQYVGLGFFGTSCKMLSPDNITAIKGQ